MRDLQQDRIRREGVREERLRATAGLRGTIDLTSWRGRSGRRYVVGVHPLTEAGLLDVSEAVIVAVRRDREGSASVVDAVAAGPQLRPKSRRAWMGRARAKGATEMHVHRLAEGPSERAAIVADLLPDLREGAPAAAAAEAATGPLQDAPEPGR